MIPQTKTCQNCKENFVIEPEDFKFYGNINVPAPTFCPECRLVRRLIWSDARSLYHSKCHLCEKKIFSMFHSDTNHITYCTPCWWSDKWEALDYGRDYDFNRPFFEQISELHRVVPKEATLQTKSVNCQYSNDVINCKNCYLNFGSYFCEDCMYCYTPLMSRNCVDADLGSNMDHAYETHNSNGIYNTKFAWFSEECFDSSFLFDSKGCNECFGGINLRNKKYYIFNQPYSKGDYRKQMEYWDLGSYARLQEAKKKFSNFYYSTPRRFAWIVNSNNVTGENISNTKNCQSCFSTLEGVENCKYMFIAGLNFKDSYDSGFGGEKCELAYETMGLITAQRNFFTKNASETIDLEYCYNCRASRYLFGCMSVRNKKYCILNKQYNAEEYKSLKEKIIKHMNSMPYTDNRGNEYKYGEYFPDDISPWTYNESLAHQWFPLTKDEAIEKGYKWRDEERKDYRITMKPEDLPDHIKDVPNSITDETIGCLHEGKCNEQCATAFRIVPDELEFYRQMNVALPRYCHNCRFYQRIYWRNPAKLWHRKCQCGGVQSDSSADVEQKTYTNTAKHFHQNDHCPNEFETAISPKRKEITYCQQCYNDEFV